MFKCNVIKILFDLLKEWWAIICKENIIVLHKTGTWGMINLKYSVYKHICQINLKVSAVLQPLM